MRKYITPIFLLLIYNSLQAQYVKHSIIQIESFEKNTVATIVSDGKIRRISELNFYALNGYPAINIDFDGPRISYHKNRFLAKYNSQYCLIDSAGQIIIGLCDSIESIFISPVIFNEPEKCDVYLDYLNYGVIVWYQAIKNGETFVYNNSGTLVFPNAFRGFIWEEQDVHSDAHFFTTRNLDYSGFGLIDDSGSVLLSNAYGEFYPVDYTANEPIFLVSYRNGIYNIESRSWEVFDSLGFCYAASLNCVHLICHNKKYGLFHSTEGIILEPNYDTIIFPVDYFYGRSEKNTESLILKKGNKTKKWYFPKKLGECIRNEN